MVANLREQNVLIVDDTPANISLLGEYLSHHFNVRIVTSGEEALQLVNENPPDLILLDIIMSGIDGYEVCRRLKGKSDTRDIPIIFISAKTTMEDEAKGLKLGAVDYIKKPFNLPIILSRVQTHLSLKVAREDAELLVDVRTAELLEAQESLQKRTKSLEETNIALQVLLKRRDQEKLEFEDEITTNVNKLVRPYLEKLEPFITVEQHKNLLQMALVNLNEIVNPFTRGYLASIAKLTPSEIQVANLIKMGKSSKEIAVLLDVSYRTIETHRTNIRKKTGINKKKITLRKYLLSFM